MSSSSPQRVRIGEGHGRIVRVGPDTVEYENAAGATHTIDLTSCRRSPEGRIVGLRGGLDDPPWFEFFGPQAVRMEFASEQMVYQQLVIPLARAGYGSLDGC
jgi:hypothetical protein